MDARDVIEALGGTQQVALSLGVTPQAVRNWRSFGVFPPRLYLPMVNLAKRMGRDGQIPTALFQERANG